MNLKINLSTLVGGTITGAAIVIWTMLQSLVGTVYANDKKIVEQEFRFAGLEAMRPQIQDILIKVDSMDKAIRDMRDLKCKIMEGK